MPPAAGVTPPTDSRVPVMMPAGVQPAPAMMSDSFAKDAIIAWFCGEFAAANAIIDALCNHLTQLESSSGAAGSEYEAVFAAIHRRRLNWIPILQMQKYYSIADVTLELRRAAAEKTTTVVKGGKCEEKDGMKVDEMNVSSDESHEKEEKNREIIGDVESMESHDNDGGRCVEVVDDDSPKSEITDTGSQEVQPIILENVEIYSADEDWEARRAQIKMTKGFVAKEPVKGHMVNVVRGLKLYEGIFNEIELSKLTRYVNELRVAGQNGELSGETFIMYNQQSKGIKRELMQLGAPIFGQIKDDATVKCPKSHIEPIPAPLESIIDHLVQWHLVSENRRPNSCIINFFDEGEYSQPFLKPPHIDQPISTLLLSESSMAFGRTLVCDNDGNYKGPLMLSLKEGSLLVMRGNSADMARHVMCQSSNRRTSITFFKVRSESNTNTNTNEINSLAIPPLTRAMTLWQPGVPTQYTALNGGPNGYGPMDVIPKWGVLRAPLLMLAPVRPMVLGPKRMPRGGTGVFLPWTVGSRKPQKHLPPRAQKGRLLALPQPAISHKAEPTPDSGITVG